MSEPSRTLPGTGSIEVIVGSMYSGKTEELIRRLRRAQIARQRVEIFKPDIDNRYANDAIVSHSDLRPILAANATDPVFQKSFARASELAGDPIRAGEAYAEAAYLNGRAEDALNQFSALLKRGDLSYIQRARIEARIAEITPEVMELQRRKIRPQDLPPDAG